MKMNKPFFEEEDFKHLPFNYRHIKKYDEATLPPIKDNDEPSGFNYVPISRLQTEEHMISNISKPISRLFSNKFSNIPLDHDTEK